MLLHPSDPKTIYVGLDYAAIAKTVDGGKVWRQLPTVQPAGALDACFPVRVLRMTADPSNPEEVYAAMEVGGIIRSLDGGETWSDISDPLLEMSKEPHLKSKILSDSETEGMMDLHALTISKAEPAKVWIANRMGLFVSEDRGEHWQEFGIRRFSDLSYARDVLKSFTTSVTPAISADTILRAVASFFSLKPAQLKSKNNSRSIAVPRQIAMYICKELTNQSLPQIGRHFGGKHHTTVLHSVRKIDSLRKKDTEVSKAVNAIVKSLN